MRPLLLENNNSKDEKTADKLKDIEKDYNKLLSNKKGYMIKKLFHNGKNENIGYHFLLRTLIYSIATIERYIKEG